ncbi:MAG: hypothetical protein M3R52_00115 [Acidobacteriota bacterium]|nr:hypothetical protein [Acidobacteriota bacterium]
MGQFGYKQFAERHRPHIHPPGATLFVTYRLAGSIPKSTVRHYKATKQWLNNQLERAQKDAHRDAAAELRNWLERVEKFNRELVCKV